MVQSKLTLKDNGAMSQKDSGPNTYPAIHFLVRHGHALALTIAVAIVLSGIAATLRGWGWAWLPAGLLVGSLAYLIFRSYAEIVQVIAETLLPR